MHNVAFSIKGDQIDPEVMSIGSGISNPNKGVRSVLWNVKRAEAIKPADVTDMSKIFDKGMGIISDKSFSQNKSIPKLGRTGQQTDFNRRRDDSMNKGIMGDVMDMNKHTYRHSGGFQDAND